MVSSITYTLYFTHEISGNDFTIDIPKEKTWASRLKFTTSNDGKEINYEISRVYKDVNQYDISVIVEYKDAYTKSVKLIKSENPSNYASDTATIEQINNNSNEFLLRITDSEVLTVTSGDVDVYGKDSTIRIRYEDSYFFEDSSC